MHTFSHILECENALNAFSMDGLPHVIIVTLVHKQANIGTVEINPLVTYPIPEADDGEGFELEI